MTRALLLVATAFALGPTLVLAAEARPDTIGVVAVAEPPAPSQDLADLARNARASLGDSVRGVLSAAELRQRMAGQSATPTLGELDRAYGGAVASFQSGDYAGAAATLRAVAEDLERLPESEEVHAAWIRAMLRLARAEGSLGHKEEAREVMAQLLRASPTVKPDPELYPPSFARQLDEVRASLAGGPRRRVTVETGGRAARVFIQGRDVGAAPLTVSLPMGRYRVSAVTAGARVTAGLIDLTHDDQLVALDFRMAESFRPDGGPGLVVPRGQSSTERARTLVTAGATLQLDRLVTLAVQSQGDVRFLVGTIYDVRRGMQQREGSLRLDGGTPPPGGLGALTGFLLTGQPSALVVTRPDLTVQPGAGDAPLRTATPSRPYRSGPLGWTSFGAGVLAVGLTGVAVLEGVSASGKYGDARGMKRADGTYAPSISAYNSKVASADSARNIALVSGGGALLAAVASGVLGYMSYQQCGEVGLFRF